MLYLSSSDGTFIQSGYFNSEFRGLNDLICHCCVEKCIGDVWLMTKTILLFSNVPRILWDEAWIHAGYVNRHLPTTANEGFKSPIYMITGERANFETGTYIAFL